MKEDNSIAKRIPELDSPVFGSRDPIYVDDYYGHAPDGHERQQIFALLGIVRRYLFLIVGITLVGTCLVLFYEARKPDYYTADVRIQVNNEMNPAAGGNAQGAVIMNQGNDPAYFTTQLQVLEGSGLLRRVVKTLDLEHNEAFLKPGKGQETSVWQNVLRMFGLYKPPKIVGASNVDSTPGYHLKLKDDSLANLDGQAEILAPYVSQIKNNLEVSPVKDTRTTSRETRLINIEYTHYDPILATKIVNALADTYVLQNLEQKVESNANSGDFLQKRVAELQSQIRSDEERLINYAKSNQIISLDSNQNTVVQRLSDLNNRLSQAENDRITAQAALRSVLQNPMSGATAESKDSRTSALEAQLTGLRQRLEQLKVEYTEEWPEVKQTTRQIDAIERELKANRKRSTDTQIAALQQTLQEASSRERDLRNNFEAQRNTVLNQNEAAINYRIIQQEISTNRGLLDNLLQRSRETEVILNGTPNNVLVLDRALVPGSPNGPQRTKNVIIALFVSLAGGIGLAFLLDWLDDTIRATDNFESQLGLPVIGMIPAANSGFAKRILTSRLRKSDTRRIGQYAYHIESFEKPVTTEAVHQLRTSILLSTAGGSPKSILVASGQPFEGKTVTSINLAKSLAQLGNRVLLIDADLRCPKIHFINGIGNKRGLSTLLTTNNLEEDLIEASIQKEADLNLDILPSGPKVPNPANLFDSAEMKCLLEQLGAIYTHIIIDSPPVLYFADSLILAASADAVVLIARSNFSSRDVLIQTKKRMQDVRANIVGIVLNDIPLNNYKYYKSAYYDELSQGDKEDPTGDILHLK